MFAEDAEQFGGLGGVVLKLLQFLRLGALEEALHGQGGAEAVVDQGEDAGQEFAGVALHDLAQGSLVVGGAVGLEAVPAYV